MEYLGSISDSKSHVTKEYVDDAIDKKADKDGVYPDMTVGMTRDMLGVGEGDEGEFLFRPTDGDGSIKDGFASIERIEGNSMVWNQSVNIHPLKEIYAGVTFEVDNTGKVTITGQNDGTGLSVVTFPQGINLPASHKFLFLAEGVADSAEWGKYGLRVDGLPSADYAYITNGRGVPFTVPNADTKVYLVYVIWSGQDHEDCSFYPCLYDLTRMFGAGNEPTTIEEFYARLPKGIDINAYNEGEVVNMNVEGIKSVGFNAWDEEWENGTFNTTTGENINNEYVDSIQIRSKNLIPVVSNASYYVTIPSSGIWIIFYDKDGQVITDVRNPLGYIDGNSINTQNNYTFLTPNNATSMKFYAEGSYGANYKNDICINLVHTGYRNGEYEPYVSDEIALPIADYFPNGMNSIGDVKDELTATEAIQRVGVVDLGTLPWYLVTGKDNAIIMTSDGISGLATVPSDSETKAKILSSKYAVCTAYQVTQNNVGVAVNAGGYILIYDPSYTDATSFKTAMSGVILYYELAEPIVTTFDKPLDLDYQVWDFGTEEAIAEGKTTPLKASIIYEFNARDTIRANKLALKNKADKTELNSLNERVTALEEEEGSSVTVDTELSETSTNAISNSAVTRAMVENEEVTAAALNELNERIKEIGANVSGETATKVELQDAVTSLTNTILENEEVTAAALNDLNTRLNEILTRLNNAGI